MARSGGQGKREPQISPLRFASVEMTKGRGVMARSGGQGKREPQVPPLRFAPVGMTRGSAVLPGTVVAERELFFITLGGPEAHDPSGRNDSSMAW